MLRARAEKMRAKKMLLEGADDGDRDTDNQGAGGGGPSVPQTLEESSLAGPSTLSTVNQPEDVSFHRDDHDSQGHSSIDDRYASYFVR